LFGEPDTQGDVRNLDAPLSGSGGTHTAFGRLADAEFRYCKPDRTPRREHRCPAADPGADGTDLSRSQGMIEAYTALLHMHNNLWRRLGGAGRGVGRQRAP
jgi:hypothetical protein